MIPAGRFPMGCVSGRDCDGDEQPVHEVEVASFALGVYEVTIEEYDRFAEATGWYRPDLRPGTNSRHPIDYLSWEDAVAYAAWLSSETGEQYRLPSEAEWEYAARAGTTTRWYWGDDPTAQCAYANGADLTLLRSTTLRSAASVAQCTDGVYRHSPVGRFSINRAACETPGAGGLAQSSILLVNTHSPWIADWMPAPEDRRHAERWK